MHDSHYLSHTARNMTLHSTDDRQVAGAYAQGYYM